MPSHSPHTHAHPRLYLLAISLFLALALGGRPASADVLHANADHGGSGGGSTTGLIDESERGIALIDLSSDAETAGQLDEAARSVDLIALSPQTGGEITLVPYGPH
jgi:hypothetical protein